MHHKFLFLTYFPFDKCLIDIFPLVTLELNDIAIFRVIADMTIGGIHFFQIANDFFQVEIVCETVNERQAFSTISLLNTNVDNVTTIREQIHYYYYIV